jgi:hypothetical protein
MALLFMDSFDHYATADLQAKWTANVLGSQFVNSILASGRRGSGCFRIAPNGVQSSSTITYLNKTLAPVDPTTCIIGVAFAISSATVPGTLGLPVATVRDGSTTQLTLRLNNNLTLSVLRGSPSGTLLGTTASAISAGSFAYLEWKVVIHPTAGTVDLRINGVSALSLTTQNTRNTANNSWNNITLGPPDSVGSIWGTIAGTVDWDDLYVLDGSGSAPLNGFLGDVRVDARYPTAAGATTAWTPSTGANWAAVDDAAPNADTDYTASSTVGQTDTFTTQDAPVVGATIYGVQHCLNLKKMDAGVCAVAPVVRHSGVDYPGADLVPSTAYVYGLQIAAVNPGTGVAWTEAGFNAAEFGYKKTA